MNFKEYIALNQVTIRFCLKACGVLFSAIAAVIAILVGFKEGNDEPVWLVFLICVVFGNVLGLFICVLAFLSGLHEVRAMLRFYLTIPEKMRDSLQLNLRNVDQDPRFHFLQKKIASTLKYPPLSINYDHHSKDVLLSVMVMFPDNADYERIVDAVNKAHVSLGGPMLTKSMKFKEWKKKSLLDVIDEIELLYAVASEFDLDIPFTYYPYFSRD